MSSSVYRALRAAGYPDGAIVDFATSLLAELCDETASPSEKDPPLDAQTGLPTEHTFTEILEFEFERAKSAHDSLLGVVIVTMQPGDHGTANERFADENLIVETLRSRLRRSDATGRTGSREFMLLLPDASPLAVASTARDVHRALQTASFSQGCHYEVRHASLAEATNNAAELSSAARASSAITDGFTASRAPTPDLLGHPLVLALCGGAAMAAAHVGVVSALEQLEAKISGIGATSAGALVAAMYAAGMDRSAMLERFLSLPSSEVYGQIRSAYATTRARALSEGRGLSRARIGFANAQDLAVTDDTVLRALVEHFVERDRPIESMRIRLAFCATDLIAGRTTYISHGSLHDGLMAACAIPGLFPPQRFGSKLLVDGSLTGELPVAAATSIAGGAHVIGCHLDGPTTMPRSFANGLAVTTRIAAIRKRELLCEQIRACDAVLRIPVEDIGWMGFSRCGDAERAGRETTLRKFGDRSESAGTESLAPGRERHHLFATVGAEGVRG